MDSLSYIFNLPPEEIVKWFQAKGMTLTWDWREMWQEAHNKSFTVAKVMKLDILQDLRNEVDKIFTDGSTFEEFKKNLEWRLKANGWWGKVKAKDAPGYDPRTGIDPNEYVQLGSPHRLKTIYQTNSAVGYNTGRFKSQMEDVENRPYWQYVQIERPSYRKLHALYHKKVFRFDDPIWDKIYPPNGFNCFPEGTKIATATGWKNIEDIKEDELVLGGSGEYRLVYKIFRNKFNGNLIRFATKHGSVSSTPNHRILTLRGWVRAENLKVGDVLVQVPKLLLGNKRICKINHSDTALGDVTMPLPIQWESSVCNALNTKFQFRNKNVYPIRAYIKIKDRFVSKLNEMLNNHLLRTGGFKFIIDMIGRIYGVCKSLCLTKFFFYFLAMSRSSKFQLISTRFNSFRIKFCFAKSWVRMRFIKLLHSFTESFCSIFSPFISIYPLRFYCFAAGSRRNVKMLHQFNNSFSFHSPTVTKHSVTKDLVNVEGSEGFTGGAPLDGFDSLNSFVAYALSHFATSKVIALSNIQYNGIVCNLGVDSDETYCTEIAVVHNCGCRVRTLSLAELKKRGLKLSNGEDFAIDVGEGWDYNPAKKSFAPDLSKYDPDLVKQFKAERSRSPK